MPVLNISADNLTSLLQGLEPEELLPTATPMTPLSLLATLSVGYALIFIAGVLGNLITCIVISRNNFMHTATNFYLFNLAISDMILLCSGMPQDLYNLWHPDNYPFSDSICILESVLSETAANATVLTITAFTVERYIAICHPFRQHTMSKLSRAVKFIFAIWIAALLLALPQAIQFSVVMQGMGSSCTMKNDFFAHVFAVSGFLFFGGPMTAICVLYVLIGVKLKRSRLLQALPRRCYDVNRGISAQTRVIRMLVAVAVAFFICWAPFHAQRLMAVYGSSSGIESQWFNDVFSILDYTSGVLYFLSTCINPLLYNIMSHKFREAFKVTLARQFGLGGKNQGRGLPHTYSALRRNQTGSLRLHTTDSVRTTMTSTTTTTTGLNGCGNGNGAATGPAVRLNRVSLDSSHLQGQNRSRQDLFDNPRRTLQTQISQLSSVGDAHSLLEEDLQFPAEPLQRQPTMCSIDELTDDLAISRSRLKLTRITRPLATVGAGGVAGGVSGDESSGKVRKAKVKALKSSSALKGLRAKFNWRARRKGSHKPQVKEAAVAVDEAGERGSAF
ncbi:pyrokinin-1 receptor isoform X2 [Drosophila subpulchrella]|uniref:pyrokinin-1 receptor isoform X2 n=1 Tax=Drosophila subpulchrella TaxID=1486046 RepID=UPI0018A17A9D|nr:pyrokinin-1 receptor isoform X2 [Drosophila subpulchrella]XP_037715183.1 pyrokinin-1 receptor isoform X2 [Drosophila subpulchrella]XP_037715191.1 pyrokinin-1 receptor isoform X2 [Drosophila subpulchrella]XP_037715200.1 pyrokinin-1 receptor isoform X2 [Drosophila subpulchrella]